MRKRTSDRQPRPGRVGHTLIEVLVTLVIFVALGGTLISFLNQGVSVWNIASQRGRIYERARAILDTVADDLRSLSSDVRSEGAGFWVRFFCDRDSAGRQRLRLVRALAGEISDPIALHGGEYLTRADSGYYDHHDDHRESGEGRLRAPAGYQEVLYAIGASSLSLSLSSAEGDTLWRGVRSPIGGVHSLFISRNIDGEQAAAKSKKRERGSLLEQVAQPLAGGILHFGLRFWTPTTSTWNHAYPPLGRGARGKPSGPIASWDSTRAILRTAASSEEHFAWSPVAGSIDNPHDDIFPERVEVTLVLAGNPEVRPIQLAGVITSGARSIPVSSTVGLREDGPFRYVRVEDEWIRYDAIEGGRLVLTGQADRGVRGTTAVKHEAGTPVFVGTSFRRVVEIPTFRIPVAPEKASRRGGRRSRSRRR